MRLGHNNKLIIVMAMLLIAAQPALALFAFMGTVADAPDGTIASWRNVTAVYSGNQSQMTTCVVSPAGNAYSCEIEDILGYSFALGHVFRVELRDDGDGFVSGPVSGTTTEDGFTDVPNMYLHHAIELNAPSDETFVVNYTFLNASSYPPYNDTLWYTLNGSGAVLCANCTSAVFNLTGLSNGDYLLVVSVNSSAGVVRDANVTFTIATGCGNTICETDENCTLCVADCGVCPEENITEDNTTEPTENETASHESPSGSHRSGGSSGEILASKKIPSSTVKTPMVISSNSFLDEAIVWFESNRSELQLVQVPIPFQLPLVDAQAVDLRLSEGKAIRAMVTFRVQKVWLVAKNRSFEEIVVGRVNGTTLVPFIPLMSREDPESYFMRVETQPGIFVIGLPPKAGLTAAAPPATIKQPIASSLPVTREGAHQPVSTKSVSIFLLVIMGLVVVLVIISYIRKDRDEHKPGRIKKGDDDE